jgi:hypothetical protein
MLEMISLRLVFGLYTWAASCMQLDNVQESAKDGLEELKGLDVYGILLKVCESA